MNNERKVTPCKEIHSQSTAWIQVSIYKDEDKWSTIYIYLYPIVQRSYVHWHVTTLSVCNTWAPSRVQKCILFWKVVLKAARGHMTASLRGSEGMSPLLNWIPLPKRPRVMMTSRGRHSHGLTTCFQNFTVRLPAASSAFSRFGEKKFRVEID